MLYQKVWRDDGVLIYAVNVLAQFGQDGFRSVVGEGGAVDQVDGVVARCPDVDGGVVGADDSSHGGCC